MSHETRSRTSFKSLLGLALMLLLAWGAREWLLHRQAQEQGESIRVRIGTDDIVMYTTDTCPYCAKAREWLNARQVPWRDCNVDHDDQCRADYQAKGAPGVPLFRVRDQWRLGLDPAWMLQTLQGSKPS